MNQEYTVDFSGVFTLVECSMCQIATNIFSLFVGLTLFTTYCVFSSSVNTNERHCLLFPDVKSNSFLKKEKNCV